MSESEKKVINRTLVGVVVSDKMNKTVTVRVQRRVRHPLYGKILLRSNRYHAHNEKNNAKEGDTVEITEGRPISKTKSWRVTKVIQEAQIL